MKTKPRTIWIGKEEYEASIFLVRQKNEDGSPALLEHIRDDDQAEIERGENEFVVAYLKRGIARKLPFSERTS